MPKRKHQVTLQKTDGSLIASREVEAQLPEDAAVKLAAQFFNGGTQSFVALIGEKKFIIIIDLLEMKK